MARETLVMLPGMMCDARLFAPQMEALNEQYDIIVPELTSPSIEELAHSVLSCVEAGSFNLLGLSMGGIVAMQIVGKAPERIRRLALLDTNHLADAASNFELRNRQIEDVKNGKLRDVIIAEMKPVYLAEQNRSNQQLLGTLIDMAMDVGADSFIAQSIALRDRSDQSETLKNYAGPSLVLCGQEDNLCPLERHEKIADLLPNSSLCVVEGAGHIATLEAPALVNSALLAWLQNQ